MKPLAHTVLSLFILLLPSCEMFESEASTGNTFYIDPVNGSSDGDGSAESPWLTLEEVIEAGEFKSWGYSESYPDDSTEREILNPDGRICGGDTVILMEGHHGSAVMQGDYVKELTIKAAEGAQATLSKITVYASSNLRFSGLEIRPDDDYTENYSLVEIRSYSFSGPTENITVEDSLIYSVEDSSDWTETEWTTLDCTGIAVRDAEYVLLENNTIRNVGFGISIYDCDNNTIRGNRIENFSGDGMRGIGSNLTFEYNWVQDNYNVDDNHDDGFQAFTTGTDYESLDNVILRGNVIIECTDQDRDYQGSLQGIGCFDGFFGNWTVENNLVLVHAYHGISLYGANDCTVINNTVADPFPGGDSSRSWIYITDLKDGTPSEGCLVRNNMAHSISAANQQMDHNETYTYDDLESYFADPFNYDFTPAEGSPALNAGTILLAPDWDLYENPRVRGSSADLGAIEKID
ncbi:MAG: right-handed parallel beta-helix repeat-containing protein [Spirochaetales bacterium]|nr:right-handed parallel beta-helix repeat-containing protein [Spirochaetales bacterium]